MLFHIVHTTQYSYTRPVVLGPHTLRLRPRDDGSQVLRGFDITITPEPLGASQCLDAEGHVVLEVWFDGKHEQLTVTSRSRVKTERSNPYDYLPRAQNVDLPDCYGRELNRGLQRYRLVEEPVVTPNVRRFTNVMRADARGCVERFTTLLNERLYETVKVVHRKEGAPHAPDMTLALREGACRDLAVLFMTVCRLEGLAARFVSGYQCDPGSDQDPELHAWTEVYLPGGGWRGFDPTTGLRVADRHVAIAAAVTGTIGGKAVHADLQAHITIDVHSDDAVPRRNGRTVNGIRTEGLTLDSP